MSCTHRLLASAALGIMLATLSAHAALAQGAGDHTYSQQDIQVGSRLYTGQCAPCHGTTGDTVQGINLRRGQFRRPMSDEDLRKTITTGISSAGMPPFAFAPAELDGVIAFIRAGFDVGGLAVKVGDPARGRPIFEGKGACGTCHRVAGKGPRSAPDLTDIGNLRTPSQLHRSITAPTTQMMPINRPVTLVTTDGKTIRGRRLNEDTYTVQLIDDQENLLSFVKTDIENMQLGKTSPMPAATNLTGEEVSDLIAYLLTLRGQP
jgi:putative heme-binding domain-containing protein